jgi:hypothetical protein
MPQTSNFHTLQSDLASIDYSVLLIEVMCIADRIDFQFGQAIAGIYRRNAPCCSLGRFRKCCKAKKSRTTRLSAKDRRPPYSRSHQVTRLSKRIRLLIV